MIRWRDATDWARPGDEPPVVLGPPLASAPALDSEPLEFNAIYAREFAFVWRCLRALGVPARQLDDAAQEVFIAVHRNIGGFRGDSAVRTWLYAIVRNVAWKQRRSQQRKGAEALVDEPVSGGPTPHEGAQDAEAAAFVASFVQTLDPKKRDVFVLVLLEELSVPEAATIIQVPLDTAYTRLRSVRAEFRQALERHRGKL